MRALLDVNVIIALLDPDHDFHQRAHRWWASDASSGWASSPITQIGVIRIMSHPSYNPRRAMSPRAIIELLHRFTQATDHQFWPDRVSLLDATVIEPDRILGSRQITELYLLALAVDYGGRLVTFDESIHLAAALRAQREQLTVV